jgi:hypothetical protein
MVYAKYISYAHFTVVIVGNPVLLRFSEAAVFFTGKNCGKYGAFRVFSPWNRAGREAMFAASDLHGWRIQPGPIKRNCVAGVGESDTAIPKTV